MTVQVNEWHAVEFGAVNTSEGVRVVFKADGKAILDVVDKAPDAITAPGYIQVYSKAGGTVSFSKATAESAPKN